MIGKISFYFAIYFFLGGYLVWSEGSISGFTTGELFLEFKEINKSLSKINLDGPSVQTSGYDHIQEAEWPFLSYYYLGLAGCQLLQNKGESDEEIKKLVEYGIEALKSKRISGFLEPHFGELWDGNSIRNPSVFGQGYVFYLLMRYRAVTGSDRYDVDIHRLAKGFRSAFENSDTPILPSYKNMWWISDNFPALAALSHYQKLFLKEEMNFLSTWKTNFKKNYLEPKTGLIGSYAAFSPRFSITNPRGVSLTFAIPYLKEFDEEFALQQYELTKKYFLRNVMGITGFRDILEESTDVADIDSGMVFMGISSSASGLGIIAAQSMGDQIVAESLRKSEKVVKDFLKSDVTTQEQALPIVARSVLLYGKTLSNKDFKK